MIDYIIVVNDNGELKTITSTDMDEQLENQFYESDDTLSRHINDVLDRKFNDEQAREQEKEK